MESLIKAHFSGWPNYHKSSTPLHLKTLNKLAALTFISFLCLILLPNIAFAAGGDTPVGQGLNYFINALLGTTGQVIATLAIMSVGLLCLFHKAEWKVFGYTVAAIGILFGAPTIVSEVIKLVK